MFRTSCSIVDLSSLEALRNSASPFPRDLPSSGSFFGPKTIKATTKMMINSGTPMDPILSSKRNHIEAAVSTHDLAGTQHFPVPLCLSDRILEILNTSRKRLLSSGAPNAEEEE